MEGSTLIRVPCQVSHLERLTAAQNARAERQLDLHFAREDRDKANALKTDAQGRRQQVRQLEKRHNDLEKRRQSLEHHIREV